MAFSWFFPQEAIDNKTPSRADGISVQFETRYRKDGARFIISAANTLKLRYDTVATGVVFYHRFFMIQSYKEFDRWVVGGACLLLAGKVEETPKKCKDILKVTRSLLTDQQWAGFGNNPKEELLTHERILLQTIKFDLQVEHPYGFLLKFAKEFKGDKGKIEKLVQMAWTFVNDSLVTTLSIQWEPKAVAVAFIYLAGKLTKCDLQSLSSYKTRSWWRQFVDTLDIHDLDSICHQVLDTYGESGKDASDDQQSDEEQSLKQVSQSESYTQALPTSMPYPSLPSLNPDVQLPTPIVTTSQALQFDPNQLLKQMASSPNISLASYPNAQPQTAAQGVPSVNAHNQVPPVGITTFALVNPLQALQNIRTVTATQQGGIDGGGAQLETPFPSLMAGSGNVPVTTIPSQVYSSLTLQSQNLSQSLIAPQVPATQLVGGVYQQHQLNPQQQLLQQYTLIQQGVKGQQYPLMVQQLTTAPAPQQPVAGNGVQQTVAYLSPGQSAYSHIRVGGGLPTTGGVQKQSNSAPAVNNMLSRQAFSSPYYQSSLQSVSQRTNPISASAKPQIPSLLPQQAQQSMSFVSYGPQGVSGQSGLPFLAPGQSSVRTNTGTHQLASTQQQAQLGVTPGQLATQGHMIQPQQSAPGHMIQPQHGAPSHVIQPQQGVSSHMIQPQQGTPSHMIQPQQGSVGTATQVYPSTPQSGGRGNLGLKQSHNKPGGGAGGWSVR